MRRLIAIPVYHFVCKVGIDKGRPWSVLDELLLWAVDQSPRTIDELAAAASLPRSLVVASLARMMQFRFIEVCVTAGRATFAASHIGKAFVGKSLPYLPKRIGRHVSFVVDRATGALFRRRDVRLVHPAELNRERGHGVDVRLVTIEGGEPTISPEANLRRLAALSVRGYDEQLATVDGRGAYGPKDELLAIHVIDGVVTGLPKEAEQPIRDLVQRLAREPQRGDVAVKYAGPTAAVGQDAATVRCVVGPENVLVGGDAHKKAFLDVLSQANRQVIVHSTFLSLDRFEDLRDAFSAACRRGVAIDILWGAESDEETISRNSISAAEIMALVRADMDLADRIRVHMRSTGSHAKVLLSDVGSDGWVAVVGSCNWLLSPFRSVELSAVLREPHAVALVARALSRLVGRKGAAFDELGSQLGILAQVLAQRPASPVSPTGEITLLEGEAHERLARAASGAATRRIVFGSHRLGATARPGALLQSVTAVSRPGVSATVVYTRASGPVRNADARILEQEMAQSGVKLVQARSTHLHGKFLAWDDDDIVVTSFNWASAAVSSDSPQTELGVHLRAPGLGADVLARIRERLPDV